ncbi:unnamed protein product [Psylliodes chrysocephalus]|uniref:Uncharacterized protein n=1 Tax=Psylliodes chrysocephalus TaxID=3402493 RepID=A0A9P0DA55_9CUCU|nr:unnamed protein product [Psylliodes chrysocephala]
MQCGSSSKFTPVKRIKKCALSVKEKIFVSNVYNFLRKENPSFSVDDTVEKTSNMMGVSKSTTFKVISELKKSKKYVESGSILPHLTVLEVFATKTFPKRHDTDEITKEKGHEVLRLPPYFYVFNPIELIRVLKKRINMLNKRKFQIRF